MKIRNILLGLLAVTAFFACTPDTPVVEPELEVSTSKMVFNSSVGERPITLTTNNPWIIETDVDWISFGEESGEASTEEQQVMVYVEEYTAVNTEPRTGKITITSGGLSHEIAVSQSASEFVAELSVSASSLTAVAKGEELSFTVTSNVAWTVASEAEWLTFTPASGEVSDDAVTVNVTVDENDSDQERTAVIIVSGQDVEETVNLTQKAMGQGSGTEASPYILKTAQDMVDMINLAIVGGETWFKMANDIDLADIDWLPVNADQDFNRQIHFDGNGKTISNLSCNSNSYSGYPSFFGVLYGSCKNLKFDNATITGTGTSGVIGGYVGTTDKPALVENVTITKSTVTSSGDRAGGVAGDAKEATFSNVSFQGTVESTKAFKTDDNDGARSGGFVGMTETSAVFENCSVDATVKGQAINLGGFVGKVRGEITCTDCSVKASVASTENYTGGFVGYMGESTDVTITGCHFSGTVTGKSSVAGLVSAVETGARLTLKKSYVQGEVTPSGTKGGGLIGGVSGSADVENCWADVTLNMPNNQFGGGVVGGVEGTGSISIKNCFMTGLINVSRGCGCIAGQLKGSSPTVEGCIAWGDITTNRSATQYSPGAVVGNIQVNGNFKNCWRNPDMVLDDDYMKLVNHDDVADGRPDLPDYGSVTADNNQYAYHGKAAAEDATISSVAKTIGWDEGIWDLSGDVPALK